jgi:hypothetical protein
MKKKARKGRGVTIQTWNTRELPERAARVTRCLHSFEVTFRKLLADENFLTLLQAEAMTMVPESLRPILNEAKIRHEIA